ncbi:MAG: DUF5058 family protein [Christensenellales bacterium]
MIGNTLSAREFHLDDPIMFVLYGVVLAFVVALCLFYILSALKRAKQLGIESTKIKKVVSSSIAFSVLPGLGIALGVVTLVGTLGVAFPAIRLSVVGALQYETQMADGTATAIAGSMSALMAQGMTARDFATIAMIMTIAICTGGIEVLFFYRMYQPKIGKLMTKSASSGTKKSINIGDLVFQVVFIGMVIGYLAMSIGTITKAVAFVDSYYYFIAVIVAMGVMYVCELLINKAGWKWLDSFSTPVSMLIAMIVVGIISFCAHKYGWALSTTSDATQAVASLIA